MNRTYIIAEAGVNHNGHIHLAKKMIDYASSIGVDCIKFQTFKASKLVSKKAEKAEYQKKHTDDKSQLDMLKELELKYEDFIELKAYTESKGLDFCSTSFDEESTSFLSTLDMKFWKIPSGEITNIPYIIEIAKMNKPIVMSTGMCSLDEIDFVVNEIRKYNSQKLVLLHCNTEYPTPYEDVNLNAMITLREKYQVEVGYSDHTQGIEVPIAAVALGASVIEKHFTLDKEMEGPDHKASLNPIELSMMVSSIRNIEKALGSSEKKISNSESKNINIARKSIVAKKNIKKGDVFTEDNLTVKRPGSGITPTKWYNLLGKTSHSDYLEDELIDAIEVNENEI